MKVYEKGKGWKEIRSPNEKEQKVQILDTRYYKRRQKIKRVIMVIAIVIIIAIATILIFN